MFYFIVVWTRLSDPCLSISAWVNKRCTYSLSLSLSLSLSVSLSGQTDFNVQFLLRHVTGATTTRVCRESKRCMTPCKCRRSTAHTKMRATSGYRNSLTLTPKTSLTQSFQTLPIKSTREISEQGWELMLSGAPACFRCWPPKVKGWESDTGRKRFLQWGKFLVGCTTQYLLNPAQNILSAVDTIWNKFFPLDVRNTAVRSKSLPSSWAYRNL